MLFFHKLEAQNEALFSGHFCPVVGKSLMESDLVEFVNSIYESKVGPIASTIRIRR